MFSKIKEIALDHEIRVYNKTLKKIWEKTLKSIAPEIGVLDDETAVLLKDYCKIMNITFEFIDTLADVYDINEKRYQEDHQILLEILENTQK